MALPEKNRVVITTILVGFLLLLVNEIYPVSNFTKLTLVLIAVILSLLLPTQKQKIGIVARWFGVFIFIAALSTVTSVAKSRSFLGLSVYLAPFVTLLSVANLSARSKKRLKTTLLWSVVIASGALSAISIVLLILGPPKIMPPQNLIFPTHGHNQLANLLIFGYPFALGLLAGKEKGKKRAFLIVALTLIVAGLVTSFSRGAIVLLLAITILAGRWLKLPKSIKSVMKTTSATAVVLTILAMALFYAQRPSWTGLIQSTGVKGRLVREFTLRWRVEFLRQALVTFSQHPVTGTGLDTFRYFSTRLSTVTGAQSLYAHNHFAQLFAETGLFGGTVFLLSVFLGLKKAYGKVRQSKEKLEKALFIAVGSSALQTTFDFNWQFSSIFYLFWVTLALLL